MVYNKDYFEESDELKDLLELHTSHPNMPVILWGSKRGAEAILHILEKYGISVDMMVDGWLAEHGKEERFGVQTRSYECVREIYSKEAIVVVTSLRYRQEIRRQIEEEMPMWHTFSFMHSLDMIQKNTGAERKEYYLAHAKELEELREDLHDDFSRKTLDGFIKGSISNDPKWCHPADTVYFHDFIRERLGTEAVFADVGAYTGDTIQEFCEIVHDKYKAIYAFEPDMANCRILSQNVKDSRIRIIQKIVGQCKGKAFLLNPTGKVNGMAYVVDREWEGQKEEQGMIELEQTSLDDAIIEDVTFIKMDVEGSELNVLKGAEFLIRRCRPVMAISAYHRKEDILEIYQWLKALKTGYRFYLRHPEKYSLSDLVLFAV